MPRKQINHWKPQYDNIMDLLYRGYQKSYISKQLNYGRQWMSTLTRTAMFTERYKNYVLQRDAQTADPKERLRTMEVDVVETLQRLFKSSKEEIARDAIRIWLQLMNYRVSAREVEGTEYPANDPVLKTLEAIGEDLKNTPKENSYIKVPKVTELEDTPDAAISESTPSLDEVTEPGPRESIRFE